VIFVFEVHIEPGYAAEQYAQAWVEASEIIQRAAGAKGTRLHRSSTHDDRLLAIASWESKAQRDAAESIHDPRVREIIDSQAEHVEIRLVGEFEDPQWVVLPPGS
jgi:hypothetical protein